MKTFLCMGLVIGMSISIGNLHDTPEQTDPTSIPVKRQDDDQDKDKRNVLEKARQVFMRSKLDSNKKIVEGLATKNFAKIEEGAQEVKGLIKGQHWFVIDTVRYKEYSKEMERTATKLIEAAQNKNMDAAALRYFGLTMNCLDCHRYIETRRF